VVLVVTGRALLIATLGVAGLATALVMVIPGPRDVVAAQLWPREVAGREAVEAQREAAENAVQRGSVRAAAQLDQVRRLTLAIPAPEAQAISERAVADLRRVRRDALAAIGQASGLSGASLDEHVVAAEARLDGRDLSGEAGVLLAPDLFAIVRRADEVFARVADAATRELTRAPGATPAPSPTPSPTRSP